MSGKETKTGFGLVPRWFDQAACAGQPTELFFPESGVHPAAALSYCAQCPVKIECLAWGMEHWDSRRFGVWGGTTPKQRRHLRVN